MSKHQRALKLELAKRAHDESSIELGRKFTVSSGQIRYWSSVYQLHGSRSFLHNEYPSTPDFKLQVITAMHENNWSLGFTSAYFDLLTPGKLFQWLKLYFCEGLSRLTPKKKGRPCMTHNSSEPKPSSQMTEQELRGELNYLRAENAVLKKLEALAQAKKNKAKKRP